MEKEVDVTFARRQLGTLLDEVFYKKEVFTIKRKGKSLAKIIPLESSNSFDGSFKDGSPGQQALVKEMHGLPVIQMSEDPTDILRSIREDRTLKNKSTYEN